MPLFAALLGLILAVITVWGYLWTQTQYYVGVDGTRVAVYKGVPQKLGPLELSAVDRRTTIAVTDLDGYTRTRVESGIAARDQAHADQIVQDLRAEAETERNSSSAPPRSPSPSPSPTGGD